jgi:hypothetical protein
VGDASAARACEKVLELLAASAHLHLDFARRLEKAASKQLDRQRPKPP